MSTECKQCSVRVRCPVSIPHTPRACRIVKWAAAAGYVMAYGMAMYGTRTASEYAVPTEYGYLLLLRTTLITSLFLVTMWALNHLIACAERGGVVLEGSSDNE